MSKLTMVLPKGTAAYPYLTTPDTKFGDTKYKIKHILKDGDEAQAIIEQLKTMAFEEFGKSKAGKAIMPFKVDEEKGEVTFTAKSKHQPTIYDIKGEAAPKDIKVGGGSVVKTKVAFETYDNGGKLGITAYLNGVQVLKLVEYQGGGGFDSAEDEIEDGYVAAKGSDFGDASAEEPAAEDKPAKASSPKKATEF